MSLCDLPLELFRAIVYEAVISSYFYTSLELRLVNSKPRHRYNIPHASYIHTPTTNRETTEVFDVVVLDSVLDTCFLQHSTSFTISDDLAFTALFRRVTDPAVRAPALVGTIRDFSSRLHAHAPSIPLAKCQETLCRAALQQRTPLSIFNRQASDAVSTDSQHQQPADEMDSATQLTWLACLVHIYNGNLAALKGTPELIEQSFRDRDDPLFGCLALFAVRFSTDDVSIYLYDHSTVCQSPTATRRRLLRDAASHNRVALIRRALVSIYNDDDPGYFPLLASTNNDPAALTRHYDVTASPFPQYLRSAAENGHLDIIHTYLTHWNGTYLNPPHRDRLGKSSAGYLRRTNYRRRAQLIESCMLAACAYGQAAVVNWVINTIGYAVERHRLFEPMTDPLHLVAVSGNISLLRQLIALYKRHVTRDTILRIMAWSAENCDPAVVAVYWEYLHRRPLDDWDPASDTVDFCAGVIVKAWAAGGVRRGDAAQLRVALTRDVAIPDRYLADLVEDAATDGQVGCLAVFRELVPSFDILGRRMMQWSWNGCNRRRVETLLASGVPPPEGFCEDTLRSWSPWDYRLRPVPLVSRSRAKAGVFPQMDVRWTYF
ncbi:hypothetical protein Dda_5267 [Drechslerella dactyloides]|uniref:Uncharacterized protein n=1 Tax=Drechslerella dactyloides TaxID=74499 RepID=A0AAD6NII9_DREDA|nr:hypothetical protein Dda_5267 [Drechslerella dactyloides]